MAHAHHQAYSSTKYAAASTQKHKKAVQVTAIVMCFVFPLGLGLIYAMNDELYIAVQNAAASVWDTVAGVIGQRG